MTVSVVIPAYNEEAYIAACLERLIRQARPELVEVILVDNASTDRTAEIARSFPGVTVLREDAKGATFARARGVAEATGELIAFLDADVLIPDRWLEKALAAFQHDPRLVSYSGPYRYTDLSDWQRTCVRAYWHFLAKPTYAVTRFMAIGGNLIVKREALTAIGGLDTSIAFYGDDTNLARRLHKVGHVRWDHHFYVYSSARRLQAKGLFRAGIAYTANYLSETVLHRPLSKRYSDIR